MLVRTCCLEVSTHVGLLFGTYLVIQLLLILKWILNCWLLLMGIVPVTVQMMCFLVGPFKLLLVLMLLILLRLEMGCDALPRRSVFGVLLLGEERLLKNFSIAMI